MSFVPVGRQRWEEQSWPRDGAASKSEWANALVHTPPCTRTITRHTPGSVGAQLHPTTRSAGNLQSKLEIWRASNREWGSMVVKEKCCRVGRERRGVKEPRRMGLAMLWASDGKVNLDDEWALVPPPQWQWDTDQTQASMRPLGSTHGRNSVGHKSHPCHTFHS